MKFKLTAAEKKALKERKRVSEIRRKISSQSATFMYHELFEVVGDDGSIKKREIEAAKLKIEQLRAQI